MDFGSRATFCAAAALAAGCALLVAQQSTESKPLLTFEVASIKPLVSRRAAGDRSSVASRANLQSHRRAAENDS
jgi:hypothetical protein